MHFVCDLFGRLRELEASNTISVKVQASRSLRWPSRTLNLGIYATLMHSYAIHFSPQYTIQTLRSSDSHSWGAN